MNKEEILNRLIQKSICINAGGKGCYSPYKNDMDWFSDIDNLIIMYEELQQENKQLKERIIKVLELLIVSDITMGEFKAYYKLLTNKDYEAHKSFEYNIDILKGDSNV